MADVIRFKAPEPASAEPVCALCGGRNGQHTEIYVPWPWPFNKSVFRIMDCPLKETPDAA